MIQKFSTTIMLITLITWGVLIYFISKKKFNKQLIITGLMGLIWVASYGYTYNVTSPMLGTINIFTLGEWILGLFIFSQIYVYFRKKFKKERFMAIITSGAIYISSLFALEYWGYHILKIQYETTSAGVFGLDIIHGPWYMQAWYVGAWLVYIIVHELTIRNKNR